MNNYYVYVYLDPRKKGLFEYGSYKFDYEVFYVGKGSSERWKDIRGRNDHFIYKYNKIKRCELEPIIIKLKEDMIESDSFILEIELIELIGRKDLGKGSLVNETDGGEGRSGYVFSEKVLEKLRKDFSDIKKEFENRKYILLTEEKKYKNAKQKLDYLCPKRHKGSMCWDKFRINRNCPECNKILLNEKFKKNFLDIRKEFKERNYKLLSTEEEYKNCYTKLKYKCPNNHIGKITWSNFHKNRNCPDCNKERKREINEFNRKNDHV